MEICSVISMGSLASRMCLDFRLERADAAVGSQLVRVALPLTVPPL